MKSKKRIAMQEALAEAWANPEGAELRQQLFPDGQPTPDEFVRVVADYIRQQGAGL